MLLISSFGFFFFLFGLGFLFLVFYSSFDWCDGIGISVRARAGWKGVDAASCQKRWIGTVFSGFNGLTPFFLWAYTQLYFSGAVIRCQEEMATKKPWKQKKKKEKKKNKQIHYQNLCILALYTYSSSISLEFFFFSICLIPAFLLSYNVSTCAQIHDLHIYR